MSLDPQTVSARLAALKALHAPESIEEASARLTAECPRPAAPFHVEVHARLAELRALCELAQYLHRASWPSKGAQTELTSASAALVSPDAPAVPGASRP